MRSHRSLRAFSLVEVTLAIGLVAFVLVALVGLLSGGLRISAESGEELQAANVVSRILGERRAAPLSDRPELILPPLDDNTRAPVVAGDPGNPNAGYRGTEYLTREGEPAATTNDRFYRLDYRVARDPQGRLAVVALSLITPWQAEPSESPGSSGAQTRSRFDCVSFLPVPQP